MRDAPKIALVDLDGTIIEHDQADGEEFDIYHFGAIKEDPITGVTSRDWMEKLEEMDYTVVVWTTRGNDEWVARYLDEKDIPYDYVNEHPQQPKNGSGKLYGDLIIDDRALNCPTNPAEILAHLNYLEMEADSSGA